MSMAIPSSHASVSLVSARLPARRCRSQQQRSALNFAFQARSGEAQEIVNNHTIKPRVSLSRRTGLGLGAAFYGTQLLDGATIWSTPAAAAVEAEAGPQILHIVLRVPDIQAASEYYQAVGMSVVRERPGNVFVGYGPETPLGDRMVIELAQGKPNMEKGNAFDHLLISTENPGKARKAALAAGGTAVKLNGGRTDAVEGPDGVSLVFTNGGQGVADPLCRMTFNVDDLEPSRLFLQGLGMKFFETHTYSTTGRRSIIMGYGRGPRTGVSIEIVGPPRGSSEKVVLGEVYDRMAISTTGIDASVAKVKESIQAAQGAKVAFGKVVKEPFLIERLGTTIAEVQDPTGFTYALVNADDFIRELV